MAGISFAEEPPTSDDDAYLSPYHDEADGTDEEHTFLKVNGTLSKERDRLQSFGHTLRYHVLYYIERSFYHIERTEWGRTAQEWLLVKPRQVPRRIAWAAGGVLIVLIFLLLSAHTTSRIRHPVHFSSAGKHLKRPQNVKIYGIVFYGRRRTVEILDCYLQRNLVKNGGWLDEIHFMINTDVEEDIDWIDKRVSQVKEYKPIYLPEGAAGNDFEVVWRSAVEPGCLYVKFDDDLVWFSDGAVEELVSTLLAHPEAFIVLGNLINSAALGWVHHHEGAIHSYLPELEPPTHPSADSYGPKAWRASKLPTYEPPDGENITSFPDNIEEGSEPEVGAIGAPPYTNHRWLPLRDNDSLIELTPMWRTQYDPNGADWKGWQLGAQQHYSFLQNLESSDLSPYHFGNKEGLWNMRYFHANINFIALWSDDVLENLPFFVEEDDEAHFTISLPRKLGKQVYIQTRSIASHFSFGPQGLIYDTDLLGRYRAYANEKVCPWRRKVPLPEEDIWDHAVGDEKVTV
ncbi:uncharacterized protein KY384_008988 [Bacidia gigantensis]|uniref:uncharacterized protein n=1 Tax=Bacidia gigantensis TaxID=2732470 RepID=UPI001D05A34A|nr:uncharacterized protein KY384_008988 [Bacidia gigantensis]KAG8525344.1 hypothetical protein KY384_008988 [Bacidia gigantensis]